MTVAFKLLGGVKSYGLGFDSTAYMAGNIFELYPVRRVVVTVPGGGIEGAIPLAPGQLQNLYQPIDAPWLTPWRGEYKPANLHHVKITIKLEDEVFSDVYYLVQEPEEGFTVEIVKKETLVPIVSSFYLIPSKVTARIIKPGAKIRKKTAIKIKKVESDEDK